MHINFNFQIIFEFKTQASDVKQVRGVTSSLPYKKLDPQNLKV